MEYTRSSASDRCSEVGGYLLEIENKEEQAHIANLLGSGNYRFTDINWTSNYIHSGM